MTTSSGLEDSEHAYIPQGIRDEFFINVASIVSHWVRKSTASHGQDSCRGQLSEMVASFYTGNYTGSYPTSAMPQIRVYGTEEDAELNIASGKNFFPIGSDASIDINDGTLNYHRAYEHLPEPVETEGESPREWNGEEMKVMFLNRIADFIETWAAKDSLSGIDRGAGMFHDIFTLCEGNDPNFQAQVDLVVTSGSEDGMNLYTSERSLVQAWTHWDNHFFTVYRSHPYLMDRTK